MEPSRIPLAALVCLGACTQTGAGEAPGPQRPDRVGGAGPAETELAAPRVDIAGARGIEVRIDGDGPFTMGLDTGQSVALIVSSKLAERLDLPITGQGQVGDGSGIAPASIDLTRVDSIEVEGAVFRDVPAIVFDASGPEPPASGLYGTLGFSLFEGCLLTFDPAFAGIRLERGELPEPDGRTILPFALDRGLSRIPVTIGPLEESAVIDSAWGAIMALPLALADELPLQAPPVLAHRARTLFSEFDVLEATLDGDLVIGAHRIREPVLQFTELFEKQIILGNRALERFVVTFDQKNLRIRFVER